MSPVETELCFSCGKAMSINSNKKESKAWRSKISPDKIDFTDAIWKVNMDQGEIFKGASLIT